MMRFSKEELERALIKWAEMDIGLYDAIGGWDWHEAAFDVWQREGEKTDEPTMEDYAVAMVEFLLGGGWDELERDTL